MNCEVASKRTVHNKTFELRIQVKSGGKLQLLTKTYWSFLLSSSTSGPPLALGVLHGEEELRQLRGALLPDARQEGRRRGAREHRRRAPRRVPGGSGTTTARPRA